MKSWAKIVLTVPLCLFAQEGMPQTTGNLLLEMCTSEEEIFEALCAVYLDASLGGQHVGAGAAFLEMLNRSVMYLPQGAYEEIRDLSRSRVLGVCTPEGASGDQIADIVVKYLTDNPADRHENAAGLVYLALAEACAEAGVSRQGFHKAMKRPALSRWRSTSC
jgi:hypothetical protein